MTECNLDHLKLAIDAVNTGHLEFNCPYCNKLILHTIQVPVKGPVTLGPEIIDAYTAYKNKIMEYLSKTEFEKILSMAKTLVVGKPSEFKIDSSEFGTESLIVTGFVLDIPAEITAACIIEGLTAAFQDYFVKGLPKQ